MLPTFRESSPSSKILTSERLYNLVDEHMPIACSTMLSDCHLQLHVLFIAGAVPWAAGGVMTLSPRDRGTCSHELN
jgi:hypothetical protein